IGHCVEYRPPPVVVHRGIFHSTLLNSTIQTHGLASHPQPRLALIESQSLANPAMSLDGILYGFVAPTGLPSTGITVRNPGRAPSAIASSSEISCTRSTRTLTISSVIRDAQRGMWMDGRNLYPTLMTSLL